MSTRLVETIRRPTQPAYHEAVPPLNAGDHLSRAEFERRYKAYPEIKKAEPFELLAQIRPMLRGYSVHGSPPG